jgi:hypothetical protein
VKKDDLEKMLRRGNLCELTRIHDVTLRAVSIGRKLLKGEDCETHLARPPLSGNMSVKLAVHVAACVLNRKFKAAVVAGAH